jgi:TonB-linked SusC/RagA family outer membrane protein
MRNGIHQKLLIMRFTAFFLLAACLQVSARTTAQQVTLSEKKAPLEKVLRQIGKQSGYQFMYTTDVLQKAKPVDINVQKMNLEQALELIFKEQPLTYSIVENVIVIKEKKIMVSVSPALSQGPQPLSPPLDVKGVVRDEASKPAAGVSVMIEGTQRGTNTNDRGEFSLSQVPENATLVFSSVNLQTFKVKVSGDRSADLSITLKAKFSELADISITSISTGYQTISKDRVNGSYFVVDSAAFNRRVSGDPISRLEGIVPGLLFNRNVSGGGTNLNLSIRGHSTILANDQPLIVVDNFPYDGDINNINPNDIESITILKDASAASIWGARSGNGVIVITTKKGKRYQPLTMELNSNLTIGNKPDLYYSPNFIASNDYINIEQTLFGMGFYNSNLTSSSKPVVSPVVRILARQRAGQITAAEATQQIDALRNNDVRNDLSNYLLQKSIRQQYSLNIKGGGLSSDYFLSFGYDNSRGSSVANSNKRVTVTGVSNFYPLKGLTLTAAVYYVQSNTIGNDVTTDVGPTGKGAVYPYARLVDDNGNYLSIDRDYTSLYTDTVGSGKLAGWKYTPMNEINLNYDKRNFIDNRVNLGVKYNLNNGFSLESKFQYQKTTSSRRDYADDSSYTARNLYNRFTSLSTGVHSVPFGGILALSNGNLVSYRSRLQLNYNQSWAQHSINSLIGAEINSSTSESFSNTLYGYDESVGTFQNVDVITTFPTIPSGSSKIVTTGNPSKTNDRFLSYFSNLSYVFNSKYSVTASVRIDKSNLFGVNTNQKAVPLYSIGGGWDFAKEKFVKLSWLDAGKLRLTYGYNGNLNKNVTAVTTFNTSSNSPINGITYANIANPGNPELRWEKISMINFGLDFGILNRRISGSIEYYSKRGYDLFGDAPLPRYSGLGTIRGNFADSKGHGIDVSLHTINIRKKTFTWTSDLLFSQAQDIVTRYDVKSTVSSYLAFGDNNGTGTYIPREGMPLFAVYSYPFAGLDANGDPLGFVNGKPSKDWTSIIANTTADSLQFGGSSRPTVFGSVRNSITFKEFTLSFNIIYKFDYYFRRTTFLSSSLYTGWIQNRDYYNRWQKPGDEVFTNIPSLQYPPVASNRETFFSSSSALVEKGDHLRLQDINLSYQFNEKVLKNTGLRGLQLYTYLNNIGLLWRANNQNLDPDIYVNNLPLPFSISFGLKANF